MIRGCDIKERAGVASALSCKLGGLIGGVLVRQEEERRAGGEARGVGGIAAESCRTFLKRKSGIDVNSNFMV